MHTLFKRSLLAGIVSAASITLTHANPEDLEFSRFSDHTLTPSPACLGVHANGDVYVGVDLNGSLGKGPNKGRIVLLKDTNNDGKADTHSVYAELGHPRGIIPMGDKVYVLHGDYAGEPKLKGMHLSVLEDKDRDGVADGPAKRLIKDISTLKFNQDRGADHTTNGISMGIDGWIYIAVGDFGFVDAEGTDGKKMTYLGGGVLRVRPDGTNMEMYTHGMRNIYDVAIDPFMNIFTRGNTNDGVGWWMRFSHHIQSGDYGYPSLYYYFTDEIIPALSMFGGGSGTGAHFLDEPTWPAKYNKQPLMADWGRSHIYIHDVTADGPTFQQEIKDFIKISQPADLDVDASGRMYIAAWNGAGYKGNTERGFVERVIPNGLEVKPFQDLSTASVADLLKHLGSESAKARLSAQQELLERDNAIAVAKQALPLVSNKELSLEARVAALFTFGQLAGEQGTKSTLGFLKDPELKEFALRVASDNEAIAKKLNPAPFVAALQDKNPRVQAAALIALGRIGNPDTAKDVVKLAVTEDRNFGKGDASPPLFTSKKLKLKETQEISVKLGNKEKLYLIANDAGANGGDHVAWFNPRVTANGKTYDLKKWVKAKQGWGKTQLDKSCTKKPLKRADGKAHEFGIGSHANSVIEFKVHKHFVGGTFTATVGFADTAQGGADAEFMVTHTPPAGSTRTEGPHGEPNTPIVIPHLAVQALRKIDNAAPVLAAIDGPAQNGAIWALRRMHNADGVDGLIAKLEKATDPALKTKLMDALARLYSKEAPYDGSWWWSTKPDPHGPYYKVATWEKSEDIATAFNKAVENASDTEKALYRMIAKNNKAFIPGVNDKKVKKGPKLKKVGEISIEDVMLAFEKKKPNLQNGKDTLKKQACLACHSIEDADAKKGPDLNKIGSILNKLEIADAILKPSATIAENWVDVTTNDGSTLNGTLVSKDSKTVVVRNIAGIETKLKASDVEAIKKAASTLMGPHLLDSLTLQEFVDVVGYLASKK